MAKISKRTTKVLHIGGTKNKGGVTACTVPKDFVAALGLSRGMTILWTWEEGTDYIRLELADK